MIRFSARAVLILFVLLLLLLPLGFVLPGRAQPTHEAVVWLDIAPPLNLLCDTNTTSQDDFIADQLTFLGSDVVLEAAWNRVPKAERSAIDASDRFESMRNRVYVQRVGSTWTRFSVRGTEAEMPVCKSLADAVAETYLTLQAERQGQQRHSKMSVLNLLRERYATEVSELVRQIEARRLQKAAQQKKTTATSSSVATAELTLLQVKLNGALDVLKQIDRQLRCTSSDGLLSRVALLRKAHVHKIAEAE